MDPNADYYAVLGVLPSAEDIVLRAAYKALAQRYHPDRFPGGSDEATRRMAQLNEAYRILSDPAQRAEYDRLRGAGTQSGDQYFDDSRPAEPAGDDPLQRDWTVALKYYPDLSALESKLSRISWKLAYTFRAYLIEAKAFDRRAQLAETMERQFLKVYFGNDTQVLHFARKLIADGNRPAARALNEAIRVLGPQADAGRVIETIEREFKIGYRAYPEMDAYALKLRNLGYADADIRDQLLVRGVAEQDANAILRRTRR